MFRFSDLTAVFICALALTVPSLPAGAAEAPKDAPKEAAKPAATSKNATLIDRLEASVNSSIILLSDVQKFRSLMKLRAQLDPLFAGTSLAEKGVNASDTQIVDFLIDEKIITQQFSVNDTEVEQEINSIQANNKIDRDSLKRALKDQGFAFEDYFEMIRVSASKRNLIDRDIRTKVTISDDDVKNYFYNHYTRSSSIPLKYHIQLISVSTQSYRTPGAARDAATKALGEIKGGDSFDEVAKRFSDHPSAAAGGDLGSVTEDQIAPLIRDQVKKLQIGQVSDVFGSATAGGFYILKLKDVESGENERLDKMKNEIRNQLLSSEYQHQINLWLDRQRQSAFIHKAGEVFTARLRTVPADSSSSASDSKE